MENSTKKIQIQSIIYGNEKKSLLRAIQALKQAVKVYRKQKGKIEVKLVYGDASPEKVFEDKEILEIKKLLGEEIYFEYHVFGFNSGTAKGHNLMAKNTNSDYLLIMNPDVILEPSCLLQLMSAMKPQVGIAEARQTPIEHAKEYNVKSGETSWASTACTLISKAVYDKIEGFDEKTFFMYCDDLDFSWRVRMEGYKIIYVASAIVYHSKNLSVEAKWQPTKAEVYYSAEAALLLAHKWSAVEREEYLIHSYKMKGGDEEKKALAEYERRAKANELPMPLDSKHEIAEFMDDEYCEMRFTIGK